MMKLGKYEFDTKAMSDTMVLALGVETTEEGQQQATHPHAIIPVGHKVIQEAIYDDEGLEVQPGIVSDIYRIDVAWKGITEHPTGWAEYAVDLQQGNGVMEIDGINYQEYKF